MAVSKYADGLPLYRQENIYARDGVELGRVGLSMASFSCELPPTPRAGQLLEAAMAAGWKPGDPAEYIDPAAIDHMTVEALVLPTAA